MTTKAKIYSPNQVALVSWLALPAAVFVLAQNFAALGNKAAAVRTMLWGGLFVFWLLCVVYFSPAGLRFLIHIACINAVHQIAVRCQMTGLAISHSKVFDFQSEEVVAVVILAGATLFLVLIGVAVLTFEGLVGPVLD
jgi:hypothetical protein